MVSRCIEALARAGEYDRAMLADIEGQFGGESEELDACINPRPFRSPMSECITNDHHRGGAKLSGKDSHSERNAPISREDAPRQEGPTTQLDRGEHSPRGRLHGARAASATWHSVRETGVNVA